jgi:hypothetical protein
VAAATTAARDEEFCLNGTFDRSDPGLLMLAVGQDNRQHFDRRAGLQREQQRNCSDGCADHCKINIRTGLTLTSARVTERTRQLLVRSDDAVEAAVNDFEQAGRCRSRGAK